MLPQALLFARRLRRYRPDALLVSTFKKVWPAGMAASVAGVPRVVSRIGLSTDLPRRHWTYRVAYRRWVDAVLFNADGIRRDFEADLPDYPSSRLATVYDGIALEPAEEDPAEARAALGLPSDVPLVGSVTRLSGQKRLDRLLDAVALLEEVHCALAGEGELEGALRDRAENLGISERVHFLGFRKDVARVLVALDLFLLTSDKEGMANAMLEAMAAGVPVVSTPVSGAREALAPGGERQAPGRVVEPEARAIANVVGALLSDPETRRAMGAEGRRRARERFSFEGMLDAWEAVLAGEDPAAVHRGSGGDGAEATANR